MIIGVTGNTGSGKSSFARMLKELLPAALVDADVIGTHLRETNQDIQRKIIYEFGPDVMDENRLIDKKKLGKMVFSDPIKLTKLNQIFYPVMVYEVARELTRAMKLFNFIILDAALILEWNMKKEVDHLVVVTADKAVRLKRLMEERRMLEEDATERIEAQIDDREKIEAADTVVYNNGSLVDLRAEAEIFVSNIMEKL